MPDTCKTCVHGVKRGRMIACPLHEDTFSQDHSCEYFKGVLLTEPGYQPQEASAAKASSQSGIPNADVVDWLRARARAVTFDIPDDWMESAEAWSIRQMAVLNALYNAANAIERGEHLQPKETPDNG